MFPSVAGPVELEFVWKDPGKETQLWISVHTVQRTKASGSGSSNTQFPVNWNNVPLPTRSWLMERAPLTGHLSRKAAAPTRVVGCKPVCPIVGRLELAGLPAWIPKTMWCQGVRITGRSKKTNNSNREGKIDQWPYLTQGTPPTKYDIQSFPSWDIKSITFCPLLTYGDLSNDFDLHRKQYNSYTGLGTLTYMWSMRCLKVTLLEILCLYGFLFSATSGDFIWPLTWYKYSCRTAAFRQFLSWTIPIKGNSKFSCGGICLRGNCHGCHWVGFVHGGNCIGNTGWELSGSCQVTKKTNPFLYFTWEFSALRFLRYHVYHQCTRSS